MIIEAAPEQLWDTSRTITRPITDGPTVKIHSSTHYGKLMQVDSVKLHFTPDNGRWVIHHATLSGLVLRIDKTIGKLTGYDTFRRGDDGLLETEHDWLRVVVDFHTPKEPAPTSPQQALRIAQDLTEHTTDALI